MKVRFKRNIVAYFSIVVIIMAGLGVFSFTSVQRLIGTTKLLSHATRVINKSEEVLKAMVDVESAVRGYVITHDSAFLEPYFNAYHTVPKLEKQLDSLIQGFPVQQKHVVNLKMLITQKIALSKKKIDISNRNFNEVKALIGTGTGKTLMDSIRSVVSTIQLEERTYFRERNTVSRTQLMIFQFSMVGMALTAAFIIAVLFYIINKQLHNRHEAEQSLIKANAEIHSLYDQAPCGYLSVGSNMMFTNMNQTLLSWLGYTREEVIGKMRYEDLLTPDSGKKFLAGFEQDFVEYKAKGYANNLQFDFQRKDGSSFPVIVNSTALFDDNGNFLKSTTTVFDNTVLKHSQKQIAFLAQMVKDTNEAMYSVTSDFHIRTWNNAAENLYGFTAGEAIGQSVYDVVRSKLSPEQREQIRKKIITSERWQDELEHLDKAGNLKHILASTSAIKNELGKVDGYVSIARDITERKKVEYALQNTLKELSETKNTLQNQSQAINRSNAIIEFDLDGNILTANNNFLNLFGYALNELNRKHHSVLVMEKYAASNEYIQFWNKLKKGEFERGEFERQSKNGQTIWIQGSYNPVYDTEGRPVKVLKIVTNITDRKKAEESLKESEEKFRNLINFSPVGITLSSVHGEILETNQTILNMFGFATKEEFINTPAEEVYVDKNDRLKMIEMFKKDGFIKNFEVLLKKTSGERIWVSSHIHPFKLPDATTVLLSASLDITPIKKAEEKLQLVNKELESFTYSVSHDLRAPLRSITGYSQILKEDYGIKLDEEGLRITEIIINNAKRMGQLIDDLLDFTRMGRKEMMKSKVDMHGLVQETLQEVVEQNGKKVNVNLLPLLPTCADRNMLRHVWGNLISNALKYSSKKETIEIEIGSRKTNGKSCYYIRDNGAGFDMQYSNKLFGVFQRLHKMNEFEGTGVGLALVKNIIDRHGGEVWAEGKLNEGAVFYFSIPNENK